MRSPSPGPDSGPGILGGDARGRGQGIVVPGFVSGQKLILDSGMTLKMICV
jgi:hypothetical protein